MSLALLSGWRKMNHVPNVEIQTLHPLKYSALNAEKSEIYLNLIIKNMSVTVKLILSSILNQGYASSAINHNYLNWKKP